MINTGDIILDLLRLVLPLVLRQLIKYAVPASAVGFLGHSNDGVLAVASVGVAMVFCNMTGFALINGIVSACDSIFPLAYGAKDFHRIGICAQRVALILLCICLPVAAAWCFTEQLLQSDALSMLRITPAVCSLVQQYTRRRIPGLFAEGIRMICQKSLYAAKRPTPVLWVQLLSSCVGFGLISLLVGHLQWGIVGIAWAVTCQDLFTAGLFLVAVMREPKLRQCWGGFDAQARQGWGEYFHIAGPSCLIFVANWWSIDALTLMAAGLGGNDNMAIQSVLFAASNIAYALPSAWRTGLNSVVGNHIGKGDHSLAQAAMRVSVCIGIGCVVLQSAILAVFHNAVFAAFTTNEGLRSDVAAAPQVMLAFVTFSAFEGCRQVLMGVITASSKQGRVALVSAAANWLVGLPLAALLAFGSVGSGISIAGSSIPGLGLGIAGLWLGKAAAELLLVVVLSRVIRSFDWEQLTATKGGLPFQRLDEAEVGTCGVPCVGATHASISDAPSAQLL